MPDQVEPIPFMILTFTEAAFPSISSDASKKN